MLTSPSNLTITFRSLAQRRDGSESMTITSATKAFNIAVSALRSHTSTPALRAAWPTTTDLLGATNVWESSHPRGWRHGDLGQRAPRPLDRQRDLLAIDWRPSTVVFRLPQATT